MEQRILISQLQSLSGNGLRELFSTLIIKREDDLDPIRAQSPNAPKVHPLDSFLDAVAKEMGRRSR